MSNTLPPYKLIFQGVAKGHAPNDVKQNLATLFKVAPEKFDSLFKKKSVVLKTTNDYQKALKYQAIFKKAGALCTISGTKLTEHQKETSKASKTTKKVTQKNGRKSLQQKTVPQTPKAMSKTKMVCPQCGTEQEKSTTCIHCDIVIQEYFELQRSIQKATNLSVQVKETKHEIAVKILVILGVIAFSINMLFALLASTGNPLRSLQYAFLLPLLITGFVWGITKNKTKTINTFASVSLLLFFLSLPSTNPPQQKNENIVIAVDDTAYENSEEIIEAVDFENATSVTTKTVEAVALKKVPERATNNKKVFMAQEVKMTIEQLKKATVYITVMVGEKTRSGSGFLVHKTQDTAFIITNAHVVHYKESSDNIPLISVTFNSGETNELTHFVNVNGVNLSDDLAVLKITTSWGATKNLPEPIKIPQNSEVVETQDLRIFGFPFGKALATNQKTPSITISKGFVSSKRKNKNGQTRLLQIDGNLNPGNSGGPIVTYDGVLAGVAMATIGQSGIGFAVPARKVKRMMAGTITNITVTEVDKIGAETELTLESTQIDPLNRIKRASLVLIPENPQLLKQALQSDGSWKNIATEDIEFSRFLPFSLEKRVAKIILSQSPKTSRRYYGQVILTTDNGIFYQAPFHLTLNLDNPGKPIEIAGAGVLKDLLHNPLKNTEVMMPYLVEDVILAGGGKYLIVKFQQPQLGIFEVAKNKLLKTINMMNGRFQMAANRDKLLIAIQDTGRLQRWDLETFRHERTMINTGIKIKTMALGWNSHDTPLLVFSTKKLYLIDVYTLKSKEREWISSQPQSLHYFDKFQLRASANGKTFAGWKPDSSPAGIYIIRLVSTTIQPLYNQHDTAGYLVPSPDGKTIYTSIKGMINTRLVPVGIDLERRHLIPGTQGQFFLQVIYKGNRYRLTGANVVIYRVSNYQPALLLDGLSEMAHQNRRGEDFYYRQKLTEEKRYLLFPDQNKLITIPYSNDRIVIRGVNLK